MATPTEIAQAQLDAYNTQALDTFCGYFADDIVIADLNGATSLTGIDAYRAKYAAVFAEFPENKVELLGRIVVGNIVIDHERVNRSPRATPFEVAAIYTVKDGKIARVDFVKA